MTDDTPTLSLFATLERVLRPKERLRFTISRAESGFVVLLEPLLTAASGELAPEAAQARAALAMPLRMQGESAALDQDFTRRVCGYAEAHQRLGESVDELIETLREARKQTQSATAKSRLSKPPAASGAASKEGPASPQPPTVAASPALGSPATQASESGKPLELFT
jgi:PRTRC genetic system protein E